MRIKTADSEVQDTRAWIERHLEGAELTKNELFAAMRQAGYLGVAKTVARTLRNMTADGEIKVVRLAGGYHQYVFAMNDGRAEAPPARVTADPLGSIPKRKYDPISWIVVTSGIEMEAA